MIGLSEAPDLISYLLPSESSRRWVGSSLAFNFIDNSAPIYRAESTLRAFTFMMILPWLLSFGGGAYAGTMHILFTSAIFNIPFLGRRFRVDTRDGARAVVVCLSIFTGGLLYYWMHYDAGGTVNPPWTGVFG